MILSELPLVADINEILVQIKVTDICITLVGYLYF
jgi:hypothetical protein